MSNIVFELFAKLGLDSSDYDKGLDDAKTKGTSAGSSIGSALGTAVKIGGAAIAAASSAVGAFATASVNAGMTFDKSMSQVAATMGNVDDTVGQDAEAMENLRQKATELGVAFDETTTATELSNAVLRQFAQQEGQTTAWSASQAADALNYMALAGYDAATSVDMLPNVLNLASAGNMDLARASDMVTDTQTAFGISLERTTQMVDEMAKASSTGNTSVEQLGDAFLVVGGLAQEMNGGMVTLADGTTAEVDNIQELEIALTAMANAGIKGSEAGTHMRNMLLKLSSPTEDGYKAFEQLGVSVFDSEGKMRSLKDIMGDLNTAMEGLTQEEKLQAISDIFNTRDVASAEALMNAVGEDWDAIGQSILNAEGAASAMAETQLDNLAGDVTLWKSALEGAQIAISDQLTPSLREFVQFGTSGLSEITQAFQAGGLSGAMEAFGGVLSDGLNMVITMLPDAIDAGMQLLGAIGQGIMDNLPTLLTAATQILKQIGQGLITAAPALLSFVIQVLGELGNFLIEEIPAIAPQLTEMLVQMAQMLIENADAFITGVIELATAIGTALLESAPILIPSLVELMVSLATAMIENLPLLVESAIQILILIGQALISSAPVLWDAVVQIFNAIIQLVTSINWLQLGQDIINFIGNGIANLASAIPEKLAEIGSAAIDLFSSIDWLQLGIDVLTFILNGIIASATFIPNQLLEIGNQAIEFFKGIDWYQLGYDVITTILTGIKTLVVDIPQALLDIGNQAVEWVSNIDWLQLGKDVIDFIGDGIEFLINDIPQALLDVGNQAVEWVTGIDWLDLGTNIVLGIKNGIIDAASYIVDAIVGLCEGAWDAVCDFFGIESPSKLMKYAGKMVDEGFSLGITKNLDLVEDAMDALNSTAFMGIPSYDYNNGMIPAAESGFNQTINIYSPESLTPSEVARETRIATRDMVLGLRGYR